MSRPWLYVVLSMFLGISALVAGCGAAPAVDETEAALSSTGDAERDAPVSADAVRPPVTCGGVQCGSRIARCCHGRCFIPREDVHCVSDGRIDE